MPHDPEPAEQATLPIRVAALGDLTPRQLYGILALRVRVFVVEQECAYQDLDGRDGEPGALLLWHEDEAGRIAASVRLLEAGEERIIGRVVTAPEFRGRGLAADLMREGIRLSAGRAVVIGAQAHLEHWYVSFGFVTFGDPYLEDGIPHVHMRRAGGD